MFGPGMYGLAIFQQHYEPTAVRRCWQRSLVELATRVAATEQEDDLQTAWLWLMNVNARPDRELDQLEAALDSRATVTRSCYLRSPILLSPKIFLSVPIRQNQGTKKIVVNLEKENLK